MGPLTDTVEHFWCETVGNVTDDISYNHDSPGKLIEGQTMTLLRFHMKEGVLTCTDQCLESHSFSRDSSALKVLQDMQHEASKCLVRPEWVSVVMDSAISRALGLQQQKEQHGDTAAEDKETSAEKDRQLSNRLADIFKVMSKEDVKQGLRDLFADVLAGGSHPALSDPGALAAVAVPALYVWYYKASGDSFRSITAPPSPVTFEEARPLNSETTC